MSISIRWRPAADDGKRFKGGVSSSFRALRDVFGSSIGPDDVPKLRAMAAATDDGFFNEVADVVERVGEIEFWARY